jgi:hypothetical protein
VCGGAFPLVGDGISNEEYFTELPPGLYTFTEIAPQGWELIDIECVDDSGQTVFYTTDSPTAVVDLPEGVGVTCTFRNGKERKLPIPSLAPWGVFALLVLMTGISWRFMIRRRK